MIPVSIVIITKNEADIIDKCLEMSCLISDDILIIDNDSTDETLPIARRYPCRIRQESWDGYGANKNKGIAWAKYDWILSIDADEIPDHTLIQALSSLDLTNPYLVYDIRFRSYFGQKQVHFGNWGHDHHVRLFNRTCAKWTESEVHETLLLSKGVSRKKLEGYLHHYAVKDAKECNEKAVHYAQLSARQYWATGKKATFIKLYLSPLFVFTKNYILRFGFLDGRVGLSIAKMMFKNTQLKYRYLKLYELGKTAPGPFKTIHENIAVEY